MGGDGFPAAYPLPLARLSEMPRFLRVAHRALGADMLSEFVNQEG